VELRFIRSKTCSRRNHARSLGVLQTGVKHPTDTHNFAKIPRMSNLDAVLAQLKQERDALSKAIAALEGVTSNGSAPTSGRPGISAAGRQRIAAAQRARWAKIKGRKVVSIATHNRTMSPAARRKIAAAQIARWAELRRGKKKA
jgi:hypothetical protein